MENSELYIDTIVKCLSKHFDEYMQKRILDKFFDIYIQKIHNKDNECTTCSYLMRTKSKIMNEIKDNTLLLYIKKKNDRFGYANFNAFNYDIYKVCTDKLYIVDDHDYLHIGITCKKIAIMCNNYIATGCSCCLMQDLDIDEYYEYLEKNKIRYEFGTWYDEKIMPYCDLLYNKLTEQELNILSKYINI